jgi:hypothetical protein
MQPGDGKVEAEDGATPGVAQERRIGATRPRISARPLPGAPNPMVPPVRRLVPRTPTHPPSVKLGGPFSCSTTTAMITAIMIYSGILAVLLAFIGAAFESGARADDQLRDLTRHRP